MYSELDRWLTAICLYREASNQSYSAILGKAFVIRNRALRKTWEGSTPAQVVTCKMQFSSMTAPGDANLIRWPTDPEEKAWLNCTLAAQAVCIDPPIGRDVSGGAEFYFDYPENEPPKEWGSVKLTAVIDGTKFWARDETAPKERTT